jgi:hypothetical protein
MSRATVIEVEAVSPTQAKRLRDAALRGVADPEWASELGRMYLSGDLKSELYEAGRRWGRLVISYYKAIGASAPYPKGQNFERFEPSHPADPDSQEAKRELYHARAVIADMREAHAVLLGAGMLSERAVRVLCEEDCAPIGTLGRLAVARGLTWLASHWALLDEPLPR